MDRREYLRALLLNKRPNLKANLIQKVDERKKSYTLDRKAKKDMRDVGRRNIDKMSPFCTPISEKATQTSGTAALEQHRHNPKQNSDEVNKRLEMLAKWKAEKSNKQKPTNQKPVFKVCHLSYDSTVSLENANKFIKGKLIAPTTSKSKFAPAGHRFKAPSNLKKIGTTPKKLLEHKPTAETNGAKAVGFRNTVRNNTTGITTTLRRSDRIKCKMGDLKNKNGPAESLASGKSEAAIKESKKGLRTKMPKVLEGDEAPSTSKVPDLLKEEGACGETADNIDNLSDLNNQSNPMRDANHVVTKCKGKGRIKAAPYKKSAKRNTPTVSDVEELLDDVTTDLHESQSILACGSANKSKGKAKTTTYKKAVRSSTPVADLEEVLHDIMLDLEDNQDRSVCDSANKLQEQGTFIKSAPDNIGNLSDFEAVENEKLEVSHSPPVDENPVPSKSKGGKKGKRTIHKKYSKSSTSVPYDDEVLHDITTDVQNSQNTSASKSLFKSKGVMKKRKSVQASKKESLKNTDDFKESTEKIAAEHDQKHGHTPIYLSPFVTKARGKQNSINEFKIRRSIDVSMKSTDIDVANLMNIHTSPVAAADYFMAKLNAEIVKINQMCEKWEKCLQDPELPEEATPSINVAIGQSQLLINKKFEQFRKLIVQCKNQDLTENCHIKCDDLHGFWDMVYLQVEDLEKRFDNLDRFKENNWVEMLPVKAVNKKPTKTRVKKPVVNSRLRDMIKAAREHKNTLKNNLTGDSLKDKTPTRDQQTPEPQRQSTSKRRSSRVSLLAEKETKSSPGLAMMKLSQSIKHGNGLTPAKSILKVERLKSTGKKSVTFGQLLSPVIKITPIKLFRGDEKENTPRRLRRSHNRMGDPVS